MITSRDNEKLKLARKLSQKKHRERLRLFVTEGEDLARAGLDAGVSPETLLIHPDLTETDLGGIGDPVEPDLLDAVSGLASGTRVIGIWPQADPGDRGDGTLDADGTGICVYLDAIADPGNVGTILRTVDALLDATVVAGPGTADHHSPHAVRASMGSIFSQPVVRAGIEATPEPRIGTVPRGGGRPAPRTGPLTICLGSEREGLSSEILNMCDVRWTVPLRPGGAESLNVAAAAAIVCERISSAVAPDGAVGAGTPVGPGSAAAGPTAGEGVESEERPRTGNGNG